MAEAKPKGSRILVVDDDPEMTEMLVTVLADAGYAADAVAGPAQALEAVRRHPPDVVVTDLCMPDMNGLDLVEAARRLHPGLRFIVLTAFGDWPSFCRAQDLGVEGYLTKPVALDALLDGVRKLLEPADAPGGCAPPRTFHTDRKEDSPC